MKVCIVGSGLSSLALANALAKSGIYVDIFFLKQKQDKSRTISISKSNVNYFCEHVVDIKKIIWKIKNIKIYSENLDNDNLLNFNTKNEQLFSIVENYKLYGILEKKLDQTKYVKKILKKIDLKIIKKYDLENVIQIKGFDPWKLIVYSDFKNIGKEFIKTFVIKNMLSKGVLVNSAHNIMYSLKTSQIKMIVSAYEQTFKKLKDQLENKSLKKNLKTPPIFPVFSVRNN